MKLGLRIEVATLRGTREAVPRLAAAFKEARAGATFLFSLGPDHTGRALGSLPRVSRLKCYGLRALLSGTLLPGADIGRRGADAMRSVPAEGHEAGILAHDRVGWLERIAAAGETWTADAMRRARERYEEIFGTPALTHGAPDWRMNRYAFRYTQRLGFRHCSDTRGTGPFVPVIRGEIVACPQLPTTLPTFDELLAGGDSPDEAVQRLLDASRDPPPAGHVYALRAEVEGTVFAPALRALLAGWRALGYQMVSLRDYAAGLDLARLPRRSVALQPLAGARGAAATEGREFLAES
jgi:peptidoglycan/xylan/chitin deacetylase (PgdA/CDA1 family)